MGRDHELSERERQPAGEPLGPGWPEHVSTLPIELSQSGTVQPVVPSELGQGPAVLVPGEKRLIKVTASAPAA